MKYFGTREVLWYLIYLTTWDFASWQKHDREMRSDRVGPSQDFFTSYVVCRESTSYMLVEIHVLGM